MLEPKGTRLGNFHFSTRRPEKEEMKYYGIFISHASDDNAAFLEPLRGAMRASGLYPLCDLDFLGAGDNYQNKIESTLDCYAAVIIVTEPSLRSDWVNYEIGFLAGRGIPVYLWDPTDVLSRSSTRGSDSIGSFADAHFNPFLPAYTTMDQLLDALNELSPYADMFSEENEHLDRSTFRCRMKQHAKTVIATLECDLFDELYADFSECRIGTLVPNFGMFYPDHGDGEHCFAKPRAAALSGGCCPQNKLPCALSMPRVLGEENKECVLLNHVMYNARLYRTGDTDRRGQRIEKGCLVFHLPVHQLYGTEFKFILDVSGNARLDRLVARLQEAGMNPTTSSSSNTLNGGRIYLSLPERRTQGLFRLNHQFSNNFLCPHAARMLTVNPSTSY